jgi:dTDP-4-amino-4,6-dideoxygalactose transaminase
VPPISEPSDVLARAVYRYSTITTQQQVERVDRVIRTGDLGIVGGTVVSRLEQRVAEVLPRRGALAVSSATAGLELAVRCLGIGPGDEVIVPELAWISVGAAIWATGATPVVAPVGESLTPSWDAVQPLLGPRTRAMILAHMRGMLAADLDQIAAGLSERGIALIEDCAQGWGVPGAGSRGVAAVFSTQTYKLIATGEGGVVATDDRLLLGSMRALSGDSRAWTPKPAWRLNYRMSEVQAAMALPQVAVLDELVRGLRSLQGEMVAAVASTSAVRLVLPGPELASNGSHVGLWFRDPRSAATTAAHLCRSGLVCYQPAAPGDLHVAASWPVAPRRSLVDLRSYADIAVPFLECHDRPAFVERLAEILVGISP